MVSGVRHNMLRARVAPSLITASALVVAFLVAAPAADAAPLCALDSASRTLTITGQPGASITTLRANGPYLNVNDADCALLNGIDSVVVDMSTLAVSQVIFSLAGGPFAPGFTNEGNGSSEIEFRLVGMAVNSDVTIIGTDGPDGIRVGQFLDKISGVLTGQMNLNALTDGATPDVDVAFTTFPGRVQVTTGLGDDVLSGAGTGFISTPFGRPMVMLDGHGADQVTGGAGDDIIESRFAVGDGVDTFAGGAGTDSFEVLASLGTYTAVRLDGLPNDGAGCPGTNCVGDNVGSDFEMIRGSAVEDLIVGDADAETIIGRGGQDILKGLGGNDTLQNGGELSGLTGVRGNLLLGGPGDDLLLATHAGADTFVGGGGIDTVSFAPLFAGVVVTFDDLPNDGTTGQEADVGDGVENVIGSSYADLIFGSALNNAISGGRGRDDLRGLGGDDTLSGQGGDDSLNGGSGTDTCSQGGGTGTIVNCEA
jgi:Ca2+-binding RTX toxin-like protein